jgi:hypothetical protein
MTSKLPWEKNSPKISKLCFKFLFLTKKFKEGTNITFLKKILNAIILLKFQNLWNLIIVFIKKYL